MEEAGDDVLASIVNNIRNEWIIVMGTVCRVLNSVVVLVGGPVKCFHPASQTND